jgi:hypothetical protein
LRVLTSLSKGDMSGFFLSEKAKSQPEQHCVVSGAVTVMNRATGEIVQPAGQPTVRCFATFAEAANYGSGGALNLPPNASEEEVAQALRERPIP